MEKRTRKKKENETRRKKKNENAKKNVRNKEEEMRGQEKRVKQGNNNK